MGTPVDELSNPLQESFQHDQSSGVTSSGEASRSRSHSRPPREKKKKVGFTGGTEWSGTSSRPLSSPPLSPESTSPILSGVSTPTAIHSPADSRDLEQLEEDSESHLPELSRKQTEQIYRVFRQNPPVARPKPAIRRTGSKKSFPLDGTQLDGAGDDDQRSHRRRRQEEAFERGKQLERDERSHPTSRQVSPDREDQNGSYDRHHSPRTDDNLLQDFHSESPSDSEDEGLEMRPLHRSRKFHVPEAIKLVRRHKGDHGYHHKRPSPGLRSGAVTPTEEQQFTEDYRPRPEQYRGGVLSTLLKLYNQPHSRSHSRRSSADLTSNNESPNDTPHHSPSDSGTITPLSGWRRPVFRHREASSSSLARLIGSSASLGTPIISELGEQVTQRMNDRRDQEKSHTLSHRVRKAGQKTGLDRFSRPRLEDEIRITVHIAETLVRQRYLMKLCQALMQYGAPTHRLEEYMRMSARVLQVDAQFLYIPGAMIMSFDDADTHTTEVKLVKVVQGLDFGKLRDVHEVYKEVVHDKIGAEEATHRLKEVIDRGPKHSRWIRIPVYGLAAVCVGPFAFSARLIDLPIAFLLGCILGVLQLVVAPRSDLYANVFEISASVITSFLARAFGSIRGGHLFCFSALAQSSIALILPGYTVLCASLELQSRSIVAGSVRMVYAIIYSLFLGFGITIGTSMYGLFDKNATSSTTCSDPIPDYWFFFFVPGFALCLIIINQAKWKQAPMMLFIAFAGYVVNYFSSQHFAGNTQISSSLGALAIGVLANLYSRVGARLENWWLDLWEGTLRPRWRSFRKHVFHVHYGRTKSPKILEEGILAPDHGHDHEKGLSSGVVRPAARRVGYSLAAAAMLPAIFVQVPSGLAVGGSLVSGLASADQITGNATNGTTVINSTTLYASNQALNSIVFNVGYSVIQVAIGITVGLFLSAIVVYPFGKRRSGLFSF